MAKINKLLIATEGMNAMDSFVYVHLKAAERGIIPSDLKRIVDSFAIANERRTRQMLR